MENQLSQQLLEEEDVIDLKDIYFLLRQKIWRMLGAFVLGAVLAGLITAFLITPKYEATASLYVVSSSNDSVVDLSDLQIGTSLTKDYESLLLGRPMMESVIENLNLEDVDVDDLQDMIKVTNPTDTRILQITATHKDPKVAMDIANEVARLGITWLPQVMDSNAPNLAEEAVVPEKPSSPSLLRNTAIGAVLLLAIYVGYVIVRFMMNDTIRSSEEFERYFNIVPLTVVPETEGVAYDVGPRKEKKKHGLHQSGKRGA